MEKKDIIKVIKEKQKEDNKNKIDNNKIEHNQVIERYFKKYVEPILIQSDKQHIIKYKSYKQIDFDNLGNLKDIALDVIDKLLEPKPNHSESSRIKENIIVANGLITTFGLDEFYEAKGSDNLLFTITTDEDLKKEIAQKISNIFILTTKVNKFYNKYFIPYLKKQNDVKVIEFNEDYENEEKDTFSNYIEGSIKADLTHFYLIEHYQYENGTTIDFLSLNADKVQDKEIINFIIDNIFKIFLEENKSGEFSKWVNGLKYKGIEEHTQTDINYNNYTDIIKLIYGIE